MLCKWLFYNTLYGRWWVFLDVGFYMALLPMLVTELGIVTDFKS